jgi:hypothetical protein
MQLCYNTTKRWINETTTLFVCARFNPSNLFAVSWVTGREPTPLKGSVRLSQGLDPYIKPWNLNTAKNPQKGQTNKAIIKLGRLQLCSCAPQSIVPTAVPRHPN